MSKNSTREAYVYALVDDFENIRYIGSTGMSIQDRATVHHRSRHRASRSNEALNSWLRSMERPPKAILLQKTVWADRIKAETHWTRWARGAYGRQILNVMDGATPTAEVLARKKAQRLGHYRPHTEEAKARISAGVRRTAAFRKACDAEQARIEAETGASLFRIPRTLDEYRQQILQATDELLAA